MLQEPVEELVVKVAENNTEFYWRKIQELERIEALKYEAVILCGKICLELKKKFKEILQYQHADIRHGKRVEDLIKEELDFFDKESSRVVTNFIESDDINAPRQLIERMRQKIIQRAFKGRGSPIASWQEWQDYKRRNFSRFIEHDRDNLASILENYLDLLAQEAGIVEVRHDDLKMRISFSGETIYSELSESFVHRSSPTYVGKRRKTRSEILIRFFDFIISFFLVKILIVYKKNLSSILRDKGNGLRDFIQHVYTYVMIFNDYFSRINDADNSMYLTLKYTNGLFNDLSNTDKNFKAIINMVKAKSSYLMILSSEDCFKEFLKELYCESLRVKYQSKILVIIPVLGRLKEVLESMKGYIPIERIKQIFIPIIILYLILSTLITGIRHLLIAGRLFNLSYEIKRGKIGLESIDIGPEPIKVASPYMLEVFIIRKDDKSKLFLTEVSKDKRLIKVILTKNLVKSLSKSELDALLCKIINFQKIIMSTRNMFVANAVLFLTFFFIDLLISSRSLAGYLALTFPSEPFLLLSKILMISFFLILLAVFIRAEVISDIRVVKKMDPRPLINAYEKLYKSRLRWLDMFYFFDLLRLKGLSSLYKIRKPSEFNKA